jgi:hypothetical protein
VYYSENIILFNNSKNGIITIKKKNHGVKTHSFLVFEWTKILQMMMEFHSMMREKMEIILISKGIR